MEFEVRLFKYKRSLYTLRELSEKTGVNIRTMKSRLGRDKNISVEDLTSTERIKVKSRLYNYNGKMMSLNDIAESIGIPRNTLHSRIVSYGEEKALSFGKKINPVPKKSTSKKSTRRPTVNPELDPFDPYLELKNRIASYKKLGMSDEEIIIKCRPI